MKRQKGIVYLTFATRDEAGMAADIIGEVILGGGRKLSNREAAVTFGGTTVTITQDQKAFRQLFVKRPTSGAKRGKSKKAPRKPSTRR